MTTMKAVRIHSFGGREAMRYEDAPRPEPDEGEVLIKVQAAGVNPVDWKVREGYLEDFLPHQLPLILGWDVAGVIEAVGEGVGEWNVGEAVFAKLYTGGDGGYAEYALAKSFLVARRPATLDALHAAGIPIAGQTAWQALFDVAQLSAGQTILIHTGAGGVGTFAVQFAKWKGAHVITTVSAEHHDFVCSLGADQCIDYRTQKFEELVHDVDVVLDTVGRDTQARSWQTLKRGGILVSIVDEGSFGHAMHHGVRAEYLFLKESGKQLEEVGALIGTGAVKVILAEVLPLAEAVRAHEIIEAKHTRGKIVLKVSD